MDVSLSSVKGNSQDSNTRVYVMATQKGQSRKILSQRSQKISHFAGKFSRGVRVHERVLLGSRICL